MLDGRKKAGLEHGGVAGLETVRWRTLAVLDGQGSTGWANGGTAALLDRQESSGLGYKGDDGGRQTAG